MRVLALIHALCGHGHAAVLSGVLRARGDADPELCALVVVGGAPMPSAIFPTGVDVVQLPALVPTRGLFSELQPRLAHVTRTELRKLRVRLQLALLDGFRPDVLLVEHFPIGRFGFRKELCAVLAAARQRLPHTARVSSVAVLGGQAPGREAESIAFAREHFDRVLIHTDPRVERLADDIPDADALLGPRLVHTGYVLRRPPVDGAPSASRARLGVVGEVPLVVLHAGGGRDGLPMLLRAVDALAHLAARRTLRARVVAGGAMPDVDFEALQARLQGAPFVELRRDEPALPEWVAAADLCVCMAGYASAAEIVAAGTRALLMPRDCDGEQLRRARRLAGLGAAVEVPATLDSVGLAALMETSLDSAPLPSPTLSFLGAELAAAEIMACVSRLREEDRPLAAVLS